MYQEEYEEGFVRLVSFAVRLASPEEIAQAEAAGSPPPPRPVTRPDMPASSSGLILLDEEALRADDTLIPAPQNLMTIEEFLAESPGSLELLIPENADTASGPEDKQPAESD